MSAKIQYVKKELLNSIGGGEEGRGDGVARHRISFILTGIIDVPIYLNPDAINLKVCLCNA
jgi:hypothetical protein